VANQMRGFKVRMYRAQAANLLKFSKYV